MFITHCLTCLNVKHLIDCTAGYVMYGFESVAQWHAESNSSIAVHIPR